MAIEQKLSKKINKKNKPHNINLIWDQKLHYFFSEDITDVLNQHYSDGI